jgi:HipA-like protein
MSKRQRTRKPAFESVDHYLVVTGLSVRGATQKDVLADPETEQLYIAKLGGRNSDIEVMTEYAIYLIGRSLGVSVAGAKIASYKGQLRFLSRYFLREPEELVHGMQLFNELYDENLVLGVLRDELSEQAMFSVQAVKAAFGAHYVQYGAHIEDELFGGFVAMLAHDALIGVQDRHHENWGVIVRRDVGGLPPRFAPLYDSARGLFCNETEGGLLRYTGQGRVGATRRVCVSVETFGRVRRVETGKKAKVHNARPTPRSRVSAIPEPKAADHWRPRSVRLEAGSRRIDGRTARIVQYAKDFPDVDVPPKAAAFRSTGYFRGMKSPIYTREAYESFGHSSGNAVASFTEGREFRASVPSTGRPSRYGRTPGI